MFHIDGVYEPGTVIKGWDEREKGKGVDRF
jgi:hypothetical protein